MDQPFLSWWHFVLVGLWSVSLVVWQSPTIRHETRFWSLILAVFYLGLIFVAFGGLSRQFHDFKFVNATNLNLVGCVVFSSIAAIGMRGHVGTEVRNLCYGAVLLSGAHLCALFGATEISLLLVTASLLSIASLIRKWRRTDSPSLPDWLWKRIRRPPDDPGTTPQAGFNVLAVLTIAVLTLALLGTISYGLRAESRQGHPGGNGSILPSIARLDRIPDRKTVPPDLFEFLDDLFGRRPEIIVLAGAILFLELAKSLHDPRRRYSASGDTIGLTGESLNGSDETLTK